MTVPWLAELTVFGLARRVEIYKADYNAYVTTSLGDLWWDKIGYVTDNEVFSTPALHVSTWDDQTVRDTFLLVKLMRADHPPCKRPQHSVIVGPGVHCEVDASHTGAMQVRINDVDWQQYSLRWFDVTLSVFGHAWLLAH